VSSSSSPSKALSNVSLMMLLRSRILLAQRQRKVNNPPAVNLTSQSEALVAETGEKQGAADDVKPAESDEDSDDAEELRLQPNSSAFAVHDSDAEVRSLDVS